MTERGNWNRAARRSGGQRRFILVAPRSGGLAVFLSQARAISRELGIPLWRVVRKGLRMLEQRGEAGDG